MGRVITYKSQRERRLTYIPVYTYTSYYTYVGSVRIALFVLGYQK
jgi:hypothetical protein